MKTALDVVSAVLVLAGSGIALVAAVGLHRLPDLYARMHAATKPATLGISLCLSGAALQVDHLADVTKIVLAVALQLITNPVGAHLLGRAAHEAGAAQSPSTVLDELEDN
ncbi:MAG: Na+/H+ antiporter subunit G [Acidimicrobiia bacterium]|nr:Na+/H+ antiporter subunit G [Acidimicrobiia bacterium]